VIEEKGGESRGLYGEEQFRREEDYGAMGK